MNVQCKQLPLGDVLDPTSSTALFVSITHTLPHKRPMYTTPDTLYPKVLLIGGAFIGGFVAGVRGDYETFKGIVLATKSFDELQAAAVRYNWAMPMYRGIRGGILAALPVLATLAAGDNAVLTGQVSL